MNNPTVLITGASGFIGSAIAKYLIDQGINTIATARRSDTDSLSSELGCECHFLDITTLDEKCSEILQSTDVLVHCATANDIASRESDGGLSLSVEGTHRILYKSLCVGVKRVIFLSTVQVYGTELNGDIMEGSPVKCESLYSLNHYLAEEVCRYYTEVHGMNISVLRIANVYGIPCASTVDRRSLVPFCFIDDVVQSDTISLRTSGMQMRNFISLQEVSKLVHYISLRQLQGFNIVNASSNLYLSIKQIAEIVRLEFTNLTARPVDLRILSTQPTEPNRFKLYSKHSDILFTKEQSFAMFDKVVRSLLEYKLSTVT